MGEVRKVSDGEVAAFVEAARVAEAVRLLEPAVDPVVVAADVAALDQLVLFVDPDSGERFLIPPSDIRFDDSVARSDVESGVYPVVEE